MRKVYLTTAIPYVNGKPHLGHAMDYLLADTYARYEKLKGNEVKFQAGTDEHGNKIYKKAEESGTEIREFVDKNSKVFRDFIEKLDVSVTDFIRTTDEDHERRCKEIWKKLEPHIYKSEYEGWYCEGCERFVTQKEFDTNGGKCPDHNKNYEKIKEQNYYLKIADFKDEIREKIGSDEMKILPEFRKNEVLKLLEDSPDVSMSRPKEHLSWGVEVPGDEEQVMYVWIDALSNYITVLGYPENEISDFWPAEVQFVGKDVLRFHAIIWPAMLLGLGLPLPKVLHSHGHILVDGQKMSKSIGNVVDPMEVLERYGLTAFRYYFLKHADTFLDHDFTWEQYGNAYNNELANDLGNLVQRVATLCQKQNLGGVSFSPKVLPIYAEEMDKLYFSRAFDYAWTKVTEINRKIDETKPWELAKEGRTEELESLLRELVDDLLQANQLLKPFLPEATEKIERIFTGEKIVRPEVPLFPKKAVER